MTTDSVTMTDGNIRCECGNLLAKLASEWIELKCRRCKRILQVALAALPDHDCASHERPTDQV